LGSSLILDVANELSVENGIALLVSIHAAEKAKGAQHQQS
jgi:hypothetical protein